MVANNILIITLLAPLIGALAICWIDNELDEANKNSSYVALWTSGCVLALSLISFFEERLISQVYISHYAEHFVDFAFSFSKYFSFSRISSIFIALTAFIFFVSLVVSTDEIKEHRKVFSTLVLILESICIALFSTTNIVIFYACFEAILIPMYLIIGVNGKNFTVGRKFFVCLLLGSLFLLGGIIYMLSLTGMTNINSLANYQFAKDQALILFTLFFLGFACKSAVFPMHIWLPDAHTLAPTCTSIILSGIFLKIGCYGLLTILLKIIPQTCMCCSPIICFLAMCGTMYGSGIACLQTNFKRLIAYTSISHIGIIVVGIFSFNSFGISSAIFQIVSHSITTSGLFLIAYVINKRFGSNDLSISGISSVMPKFVMISFPIMLSAISFPLTSNFVGEVSILISIFYTHGIPALCILCAELMSGFYIIRAVKSTFFGVSKNQSSAIRDVNVTEKYLILSFSLLIILLGIYSKNITGYILPYVKHYL